MRASQSHSQALWGGLLLPGHQPVRHVTAQNTRLNQAQEKAMQYRGCKHGMYEIAAHVTLLAVLQQIFFLSRKSMR